MVRTEVSLQQNLTCPLQGICKGHEQDLQLLHAFNASTVLSGFIISPEKSRIFSFHNLRALPEFIMSRNVIPHCTQYLYLGASIRIIPGIPARQRVHPILKDLDRLQHRFNPVKCYRCVNPGSKDSLCTIPLVSR